MTLSIRNRAAAVSLVAAAVAAVFATATHTSAVHPGDTTGAVVVAVPPTSTDGDVFPDPKPEVAAGAVVVAVPPTSTDGVDAPPTTDEEVFPDPKPKVAAAYPTNL